MLKNWRGGYSRTALMGMTANPFRGGALAVAAMWAYSTLAADPDFHDRFELRPDLQGPSIQITPPDDWTILNSVEIIFQDPSGLATRSASFPRAEQPTSLNSTVATMTPFLAPATEATFELGVTDATGLLGEGVELAVAAQDIFGNFSLKTTTLVADSVIRTGSYALDTPFVSDALTAEYCPPLTGSSSTDSTIEFNIEAVAIRAAYSPFSFLGDELCVMGELCLTLDVGELRVVDNSGEIVSATNAFINEPLADLETSQIDSSIMTVRFGSGSNYDSWAYGASVDATFLDQEPRQLIADIKMYCFVETSNEPGTGCPISRFESCDVDTFGPFRVEGTLQSE